MDDGTRVDDVGVEEDRTRVGSRVDDDCEEEDMESRTRVDVDARERVRRTADLRAGVWV